MTLAVILDLLQEHGLLATLVAVVVIVLLRGEVVFRYPKRRSADSKWSRLSNGSGSGF